MAKSYEVLYDTRLRGRAYASGSFAILGDEAAAGYIRAGLIKGDAPAEPKPEPKDEELEPRQEAPQPKKKKQAKD